MYADGYVAVLCGQVVICLIIVCEAVESNPMAVVDDYIIYDNMIYRC